MSHDPRSSDVRSPSNVASSPRKAGGLRGLLLSTVRSTDTASGENHHTHAQRNASPKRLSDPANPHHGSGSGKLHISSKIVSGSGKLKLGSSLGSGRFSRAASVKSRAVVEEENDIDNGSPVTKSGQPSSLRELEPRTSGVLPPKHSGTFTLKKAEESHSPAEENAVLSPSTAGNAKQASLRSAPRGGDGEEEDVVEDSFITLGQKVIGKSEQAIRMKSTDEDTQAALFNRRRRHSSADESSKRINPAPISSTPVLANRSKASSSRGGMRLDQELLHQANIKATASKLRADDHQPPSSHTSPPPHAITSSNEGSKRNSQIRQGRTSLLAGVDPEKIFGKTPEGSTDTAATVGSRTEPAKNLSKVVGAESLPGSSGTRASSGSSPQPHSDNVVMFELSEPVSRGSHGKSKRVAFSKLTSSTDYDEKHDELFSRGKSKKVGFAPIFGRSKSRVSSEDKEEDRNSPAPAHPTGTSPAAADGSSAQSDGTSSLAFGRSRTLSRNRAKETARSGRGFGQSPPPNATDLLIERSKSSVLEQDERIVAKAAAEMVAPSANSRQSSTLECLVQMLRGVRLHRRKGFRKSVECFMYLSEMLDELCWIHIGETPSAAPNVHSSPAPNNGGSWTKESAPSASPSPNGVLSSAHLAPVQRGNIPLLQVDRIKSSGAELVIEFKDDSFDVVFGSKEEGDVWATGMSCLVPLQARVKMRNKTVEQREKYNMFLDTFNGAPLFKHQRVDRFIILSQIGDGANSVVKLALSMEDTMFYAVKVVPKSLLRKQNRGGVFGNKNGKTGLGDNREIAIMKKLDHGNIVRMKDVYDDPENDCIYIVLEYMPGGYVMSSAKLDGGKPLTEHDAREVFLDVLAGLEYLHKRGILHRDIKPENLLRKCSGVVKISDFGSAKLMEGGAPHTSVGTPAFTPPELCLSDKAPIASGDGSASDVWSLGVTLFYMLYGRVPFIANGVFPMYEAICTHDLALPRAPFVSQECRELLRLILNKDDKERLTIAQIWQHEWVRDALNDAHCRHRERLLRAGLARLAGSKAPDEEEEVHVSAGAANLVQVSQDEMDAAIRETVMTDDPEHMPEDLLKKKHHVAVLMRQASRSKLEPSPLE
eukprot:CAMPEP_0185847216 /NCGR_PEP_ID=MMETSP1354-20130828/2573_1 /TAXON_ID=708628 /ORGANISM="Erythrolobus madagascarensis, Strain CCMP3276" /LENGTH=1105 /DNA_ID=CAMNT_0028547483 /DNA_START=157 /DNA_END=3474 /DNA_ORIENTATION=-